MEIHTLHTLKSNGKIFTGQDQSDDYSDNDSECRAGLSHNDDSSDEDFSSAEAS